MDAPHPDKPAPHHSPNPLIPPKPSRQSSSRPVAAAPSSNDDHEDAADFPEVNQMSTAAHEFVSSFDFAASRRFIQERVRQVRQEVRSYALAIGVLLIAGATQYILRHPGDFGAVDRTDVAFAVLLVLMTAFAIRRLIVLQQLPGGPIETSVLQRLSKREADRVTREQVLTAAGIMISVAALLCLMIDSILDRDWLFTAAFAVLAIGAGSTLHIYLGARARTRAKRYIGGEMGSAQYTSGRDRSHDKDSPSDH